MISISQNLHIVLNNPSKRFTLGLHNEQIQVVWVKNLGDDFKDEDIQVKHKLILGFLVFSIEIIY
jgi:hypothetical protein